MDVFNNLKYILHLNLLNWNLYFIIRINGTYKFYIKLTKGKKANDNINNRNTTKKK